jgi:hypothetical protein
MHMPLPQRRGTDQTRMDFRIPSEPARTFEATPMHGVSPRIIPG